MRDSVIQTRCRTSNVTRRMHVNAVELTGIDFPRCLTRENRFDAAWNLIYQSSLFSVNSAFSTLRLLIPTEPKNRKLSKIETLRLAKSYISHLSATLVIGELRRKTFHKSQKWFIVRRKFFVSSTLFRDLEQKHGQPSCWLSLQHLHILRLFSHSSKED